MHDKQLRKKENKKTIVRKQAQLYYYCFLDKKRENSNDYTNHIRHN